jgi:hypothetical protein
MTLPSSGPISFDEIGTELDTPQPNLFTERFYTTATSGGATGLMYHNYNNMGPTGNASAKNAIFDPFNSGANFAISNWYNYSRDVGMVMEYDITNSSSTRDIAIEIGIRDSSNTPKATIFNGTIPASGSASAVVDTGLLTITDSMTAGYRIWFESLSYAGIPLPPSPPNPPEAFTMTATVNSASDIDGVGAGTGRTTYGPFLQEINNSTPTPPAPAEKAVDTSGSTIFVNKRTFIEITLDAV